MVQKLVVTLASGDGGTYEDQYPVNSPFQWTHDKLIIGEPILPSLFAQYNTAYVISLTVEERE